MTRYLSVTEYARYWRRPRSTVKRWIERGHLKAVRIGRQWAIDERAEPPSPPRGRNSHRDRTTPEPADDPAARAAVARLALPVDGDDLRPGPEE